MERKVPDELDELLGARDEVGLAVDLDEHPDLVAGVDVALDGALAGLRPGALGGLRLSLGAQDLHRAVEVAVGLDQRVAAVVDARAGASAASRSSASRLACSSASRLACSSASRRSRSSLAASSSATHTPWASATTSPIALVTAAQERIASSLPGIT